MQTITIIGTRHQELGLCTSQALYNILESIQPEIIFEELPPSYFDQYYNAKTKRNLETDAINLYLEKHPVKQVPVDSDDIPNDDFFKAYEKLIQKIEGSIGEDSFHFRNLTDAKISNIRQNGFDFLNSSTIVRTELSIQTHLENYLRKLNDEESIKVNDDWKNWNYKRENIMLDNIYQYSKSHDFGTAVFTIGAAHLFGIKQKLEDRKYKLDNSINWVFYNIE